MDDIACNIFVSNLWRVARIIGENQEKIELLEFICSKKKIAKKKIAIGIELARKSEKINFDLPYIDILECFYYTLSFIYSKDNVEESEISVITSYYNALDLSQSQVDKIFKDAMDFVEKFKKRDKEEYRLFNNSMLSIDSFTLIVKISPSASYASIALSVKKLAKFHEVVLINNEKWLLAVFSKARDIDSMIYHLRQLKDILLYRKREVVKLLDIDGYLTCMEKRCTESPSFCWMSKIRDYDRDDVNFIGCKQIHQFSWDSGFGIKGKWDGDVFLVDKYEMSNTLLTSINKSKMCPYFNELLAMDIIDRLPNKIHPKMDANWDYVMSVTYMDATDIDKAIKEKTISIVEMQVDQNDKESKTRPYYVNHVKPTNYDFIKSVIKGKGLYEEVIDYLNNRERLKDEKQKSLNKLHWIKQAIIEKRNKKNNKNESR